MDSDSDSEDGYFQTEDGSMVKWNDVAGLQEAKDVLKESVIFPLQNGTGGTRTPASVLLYGAPGSGKTYLARALASQTPNASFLRVASSDLCSKWLVDAEKIVQDLFHQARERAPCVVFLDDVDLVGKVADENESTLSKRVRSALVEEMKHVRGGRDGVALMAATSRPWLLDVTILELLDHRIYLQLPKAEARAAIFKTELQGCRNNLTDENFTELGALSEGFTGADICVLVRDVMMEPLRKVQRATHYKRTSGPGPPSGTGVIMHDMLTICSPEDPDAIKMTWEDLPAGKLLEPVVEMADMLKALDNNKPSISSEDLKALERFSEQTPTRQMSRRLTTSRFSGI